MYSCPWVTGFDVDGTVVTWGWGPVGNRLCVEMNSHFLVLSLSRSR